MKLIHRLKTRWQHLHDTGDSGYSTEATVAIAVLAAAALVILGIIVSKVTSKAESIDLGVTLIQLGPW